MPYGAGRKYAKTGGRAELHYPPLLIGRAGRGQTRTAPNRQSVKPNDPLGKN